MDKFDIHKWQRDALLSESKRFGFHPLHTEERYRLFSVEKDRLAKKYSNIDDGDTLRYIVEHLYDFIVDSQHLNEDITTEEAGNDERMKDLILAIRPIAKNFIEFAKKKGKLKELESALTTAETELNIDIPDSPEEASGISKSELESIGRVKNLIGDQELGENLEDLEKKVRNLLAGSGLLITTLGALAKVSKVAGALDMTGVGIFFMAVSMLLTHYKNRKDESINEFGIEEKPDDWTPTCPKCYNKLLVPDIFGYSICLLCGFVNIGN